MTHICRTNREKCRRGQSFVLSVFSPKLVRLHESERSIFASFPLSLFVRSPGAHSNKKDSLGQQHRPWMPGSRRTCQWHLESFGLFRVQSNALTSEGQLFRDVRTESLEEALQARGTVQVVIVDCQMKRDTPTISYLDWMPSNGNKDNTTRWFLGWRSHHHIFN